jgi:hypothetical protein
VPRRQQSYAWALHAEAASVPLSTLSPRACRGLEFARALARDAQMRKACSRGWKEHRPLTTRRLAAREDVSEPSMRRYMALARRELFGELGDSAIYKRRQVKLDREERFCEEAGCDERIPAGAHGNIHYCPKHATGAFRARRSRR